MEDGKVDGDGQVLSPEEFERLCDQQAGRAVEAILRQFGLMGLQGDRLLAGLLQQVLMQTLSVKLMLLKGMEERGELRVPSQVEREVERQERLDREGGGEDGIVT